MSSMCLFFSRRTKTFSLAQKIILPLTPSDVTDILLDLIKELESKLIPALLFAQKQVKLPTSQELRRLFLTVLCCTKSPTCLPSFVNEPGFARLIQTERWGANRVVQNY